MMNGYAKSTAFKMFSVLAPTNNPNKNMPVHTTAMTIINTS